MGGYGGEGKANKSAVRVGRKGKAYKFGAGGHSSTHLRPNQTSLLPTVFTSPPGFSSWISPSSIPGTAGPSHIDSLTSPWQNLSLIGHLSGPCPGPSLGCALRSCAGSTGSTTATVRYSKTHLYPACWQMIIISNITHPIIAKSLWDLDLWFGFTESEGPLRSILFYWSFCIIDPFHSRQGSGIGHAHSLTWITWTVKGWICKNWPTVEVTLKTNRGQYITRVTAYYCSL